MKSKVAIICVLVSLFGVAIYLGFELGRSHGNDIADVTWRQGAIDMTAFVRVLDTDGKPRSRATVIIKNNSGFTQALTDDFGLATLKLGEFDVEEIQVEKNVVYTRANAGWFGRPTVRHGLIVDIKMKVPVRK